MKLIPILLLSLLSVNQAIDIDPPEKLIATVGGNTQLTCTSSTDEAIIDIQWLVNGSLLENLPPSPYVQVNPTFNMEFGTGQLEFRNLTLIFNTSRIQCRATFASGNTLTSTDVTILLIQGLLSAVGDLVVTVNDSIATLTWTAPFSLDINGVDPDIDGYCVNISRSNSLVNSECEIQETRYSYTLPPDSACHMYNFTVTPENVVGFGPTNYTIYSPSQSREPVLADGDVLTLSAGVCSAELTFVDLDTGLSGDIITLTINDTITTKRLRVNRRYNVTVDASNSAGSATSYVTLSTHDIVYCTAMMNENGIEVTTLYSEDSDAIGALFDFVFIDDNGDVDFTRSILLALDRNTSLNHTLPFNLYPGQYRVFVYDIESDGTLYNGVGYPAVTNDLFPNSNGLDYPQQVESSNCIITTTSSTVISAECTFPSDTMATGFQMIAQLDSSSEVHKLHVSQSMDLQTPVTVEVEESGIYQVTIFVIREETGIVVKYMELLKVGTTISPGVVAGIVIAVAVAVAVAVVAGLIIGISACRRKNRTKKIQLSSNGKKQDHDQDATEDHSGQLSTEFVAVRNGRTRRTSQTTRDANN